MYQIGEDRFLVGLEEIRWEIDVPYIVEQPPVLWPGSLVHVAHATVCYIVSSRDPSTGRAYLERRLREDPLDFLDDGNFETGSL